MKYELNNRFKYQTTPAEGVYLTVDERDIKINCKEFSIKIVDSEKPTKTIHKGIYENEGYLILTVVNKQHKLKAVQFLIKEDLSKKAYEFLNKLFTEDELNTVLYCVYEKDIDKVFEKLEQKGFKENVKRKRRRRRPNSK